VGETLSVYSTLPTPLEGAGRDAADGQRLALLEAGGRAGAYAINFALVEESGEDPEAAAAAAAREALADPQVVAVIGGLDSTAARVQASLLNAAGILFVSPGAGDPGLTCGVAPGLPERYQPAGAPAFARLVPDDRALARALVEAAGRGRIAVESEAGEDARRLAREVRALVGPRLVADARRATAVVYAGEDPESAAGVAEALRREAPAARVVLPDALVRSGVQARLDPATRERAVLVASAPPAPPRLQAAFRARFGRAPGPGAVVGYEAMRSVLDAVRRTGEDAARRSAVIAAYLSGRPSRGALGTYRIEPSGALAPARFTIRRAGRARTLTLPAPPCTP